MADNICNNYVPFSSTEEVCAFSEIIASMGYDELKENSFPNVDVKTKSKKGEKRPKNKARSYHCPHCETRFLNACNLQSHIRTHTGEKPYKCNLCNLSFNQSSNLKSHKRVHTGEKPFKCPVCNKAFARSSHLIGHQRLHTGDMPYMCRLCTKRFYTSTRLKKHIKEKHQDCTVSLCGVCDRSFVNSTALQLHLLLHEGERPFKCTICYAGFRSKDDWKIHIKLHVNSFDRFECPKCTKRFQIKFCYEKHCNNCTASPFKKNELNYLVNSSDSDMKYENEVTCDDFAPNDIVISTAPLDPTAVSNEVVIQVGEEFICDNNQLDENVLNFRDMHDLMDEEDPQVFDIQFKEEDPLDVSLLQVVDYTTSLF